MRRARWSASRTATAGAVALTVLLTPALISFTEARTNEPDEQRSPRPAPGQPEARTEDPPTGTADVRLLGVNDFHGNLEPLDSSEEGQVGGAAYLAAHLDRYERQSPGGTIRVHAGDMVGASPLISGHFHDEPTIYAANDMGFDVGTVGNHEFDEGGEEMLRLINGGHREDGKQFKNGEDTSDKDFPGADFPYIAANTLYRDTGETVLPPYKIIERDGARVGFIGVTTEETPEIVMPDAVEPFAFLDISDAVNRRAAELRRRGVEAIVVLAHAGGSQLGPDEATGEILSEAEEMSGAVDVVVAGHSHNRLNVRVGNRLVVEAGKYGMSFSAIDLKIDRATGEVTSSEAEIVSTANDAIDPDPEVGALVEEYRERVAPISERVIGTAAADIALASTEAGESALGQFVADAQREFAGADIAFVPPGGLRQDLETGHITYGDLFSVQPFGLRLVKMELTGAEIRRLLERQHDGKERDMVLQISGLNYTLAPTAGGPNIESVTLANGATVEPGENYTVVVNGFLADGGGGFAEFADGRNREKVGEDLEALVAHVGGLPRPFAAPDPVAEWRITLE